MTDFYEVKGRQRRNALLQTFSLIVAKIFLFIYHNEMEFVLFIGHNRDWSPQLLTKWMSFSWLEVLLQISRSKCTSKIWQIIIRNHKQDTNLWGHSSHCHLQQKPNWEELKETKNTNVIDLADQSAAYIYPVIARIYINWSHVA